MNARKPKPYWERHDSMYLGVHAKFLIECADFMVGKGEPSEHVGNLAVRALCMLACKTGEMPSIIEMAKRFRMEPWRVCSAIHSCFLYDRELSDHENPGQDSVAAWTALMSRLGRTRDNEDFDPAMVHGPLVYAIRCTGSGRIKIGKTDGILAGRVAGLSTGASHPLEVVGWWRDDEWDEPSVHQEFAEHRAHREWFYPDRDLMDFIYEQTVYNYDAARRRERTGE